MINSSIVDYYNQFDEWGRLDREPIEFLVNWHYMRSSLPAQGHILDIGAGPGKYSMALAQHGYEVTLADLTPRLVDIARDKAEELGLTEQFRGFHVADATNLNCYEDQIFDAALMLGPLYHLQEEADRSRAARELHRITKTGGLVFVAFMTRTRHLMTSLSDPQQWKPNHEPEGIAAFAQTGKFNHTDAGRFTGAYYYNIDEIEPFMEAHGFRTIQLIGSSSIAGGMRGERLDYWQSFGEERFREIMDLVYREAANRSNLGASSHLLYIGRAQ
ncbi:methyltransferase family protein [Paenibacillus cellulosilyticus]|uniref:Methyltransferase family protein n=1 Tax=Paenibacillus cellulosilyticus TaxID=375489 RepID=A0A2V2YL04_9BACL|nr:class I SAM-dependent methyltransferase [Paenibacillus cellulosilyticus]PWV93766.1 methyltransferase family protein [Paenibacillus cellulosilyticus]QKS47391.1 class I SAM-dependent methyltransferase [Paenibacillus cellulosilyticus]